MKILLVVYDHEMYMNWFPMSLGYIAAAARDAGATVEIWNQDIHHYKDSELTDHLNQNTYDIIGLNAIGGYWEYNKLKSLSAAINKSLNRPPIYIVGGHLCAPHPGYFIDRFGIDVVVLGEGELVIKDIVCGKKLHDIPGIATRVGNTGKRNLIQNLDEISIPAYDLFPMEIYRLQRFAHAQKTDFTMAILSGRGCTFQCSFCYRLDKGHRARSSESIIDEIQFLQKQYRINYICFSDELLMTSEERTVELCKKFIESGLGFKWSCNGRLNFATPEVLEIMKRAGCVFINYGIESLDDEVLERMNKKLTYDQIMRGIGNTHRAKISPGLNIIFGNPGDNRKTLQKSVHFLLNNDNHAQLRTIRPVTPYPGSPLYYKAIEDGLLEGIEDFYECKHTNSDLLTVNFTNLPDHEFYSALHNANNILIGNYLDDQRTILEQQTHALYVDRDTSFRGFRQS